jgi:DNA polymerase III delta subunit
MIVTLTGSNAFGRRQALQQLTADFVKQHTDLGLEQYEGETLTPQQLPSLLQAVPFLSSRRLVVLKSPSANKELPESLAGLLDSVSESTDLIIDEPTLDKRTSYYKQLQKQTDFRLFDSLAPNQLVSWLVEQAQQQQATLSNADARYLVERVGGDQLRLAGELAKLVNYQPNISRSTIDLMTEPSPQGSTFDLLDAALRGDTAKTLQLYRQQRQQ